jgi:signal transduction histidine kinase
MTVEGEKFIQEMLQAIRSEIGELRTDVLDLKLRQSASEHFEQGLMAHIASIHSSVDDLGTTMRTVKKRLELVE